MGASLNLQLSNETDVRGLYAIDPTADGTPDLAGRLLVDDFDGNGTDDLALALPGGKDFDNQPRKPGKVHVEKWPVIGDVARADPAQAGYTAVGDARTEPHWVGASIASGDMDGAGAADLMISAPLRDQGAGAVYVIHGGTIIMPGETGQRSLLGTTTGTLYATITGESGDTADASGDRLGYAMTAADFNGDGFQDLAMGAPGRLTGAVARI